MITRTLDTQKFGSPNLDWTPSRIMVYFSGPIRGGQHKAVDVSCEIVKSLGEHGFEVLSEHVASPTESERERVFQHHTGIYLPDCDHPWVAIRNADVNWVDRATHLIAVVDGPSHGVGMEIERALLKPERGLRPTPILYLVDEQNLDSLSWMIRGITDPIVNICTYQTLNEATVLAIRFLQQNSTSEHGVVSV